MATHTFTLHHDAFGRLVLTDAAGKAHVGVEPIRSFPISNPHQGISICDPQGREVAWVDNDSDLAPEVRSTLLKDLARREFTPILRRIIRISSFIEPADWLVETDRGTTTIRLKSDEDVRRMPNFRAMVVDAYGTRYLVPDTRSLEPATGRILERYL